MRGLSASVVRLCCELLPFSTVCGVTKAQGFMARVPHAQVAMAAPAAVSAATRARWRAAAAQTMLGAVGRAPAASRVKEGGQDANAAKGSAVRAEISPLCLLKEGRAMMRRVLRSTTT